MASPRVLDAQIDHLYQLPLEEFTAARNVLAKEAGADSARIRALPKPPVAAWAVNQLYWRNRDVWDDLIAAAENARRAQKAVLAGRAGDVRAANKVHDDAVEAALKAMLGLLGESGHPASDATKQAIATTLRALPGDEPPGRLTRTLQPGGFEALAGLSIGHGGAARPPKPAPAPPPPQNKTPRHARSVDAKALTRTREAAASAARTLREAEQAARREEFELARATREEKRAAEDVERARTAMTRAKGDLEQAEREASAAEESREAAEKRARDANNALTVARKRAEAAAAELKKMEHE